MSLSQESEHTARSERQSARPSPAIAGGLPAQTNATTAAEKPRIRDSSLPHGSLTEHFDSSGGALKEAWEYRELLYFLAWRDVKVRYKQTALGVLWAIIQPLLTMMIFTVLFGRLAKLPSDGVPLPIFYFSGLLPWIYVSTTVSNAAMSLLSNSNLLTKIYFPRFMLPAAAAVSGLLDFLIGSVVLAGLVLWYRLPVNWTILLWPALLVLMTMLALGVGMFLAALNVKYRDVKYAIPFAIQLWLFVTPVIYPASMIPARFQWLLALNPAGGLVEGFRHSLAPTGPMRWGLLGISAAMTTGIFIVALAYFKRTERTFVDIM